MTFGSGSGSGDGYADPRLVTPDQVEDLLVSTLRARHLEHLAAQERRHGRRVQQIEPLARIGYLSDTDQRSSKVPVAAALIGCVGLLGEPRRNEFDTLEVDLQVAVEVSVFGAFKRDTMRRRDWMAMTVIECLLQRTPRDDLISALWWTDSEPVDARRGTNDLLATERILLAATVPQMVSIAGGLPATDDLWAPGGPGGPPPDGEPYTPPEGLPEASDVKALLERRSIN